jgi:hypothetical protein
MKPVGKILLLAALASMFGSKKKAGSESSESSTEGSSV